MNSREKKDAERKKQEDLDRMKKKVTRVLHDPKQDIQDMIKKRSPAKLQMSPAPVIQKSYDFISKPFEPEPEQVTINTSYEEYKPSYEEYKPSYEEYKPSYEEYKPSYEEYKPSYEEYKPSYEEYKPSYEEYKQDKPKEKSPIKSPLPLKNIDSYKSPVENYQYSPLEEYKPPPVEEYKPPVEEYKPPVEEYKPPVEEYKPPVEEYKPPVEEYKQPVEEYKQPVEEYKPSVEEYKPSVDEYKPPVDEYEQIDQGKEFTETLVVVPSRYTYEGEDMMNSEVYNNKRFEEVIMMKGFMILEYFIQSKYCSFILLQLPTISETVMVYVNRQKYSIDVSTSSYKKTEIERIKVEKDNDDITDYENIIMDGFELNHSLDVMGDTNTHQKNLAYYMKRQLSRMMYITKNIEIKPGIITEQLLGAHDVIYHTIDRPPSKEFYPVISLETLFTKTFHLAQNLPVFYKKFYQIVNQSNVNKINSLELSLMNLLNRIKNVKNQFTEHRTLEMDQLRVKQLLSKISEKESLLDIQRRNPPADAINASYYIRQLDEQQIDHDKKRSQCNALYMEIKKQYDNHVFNNELAFYELFSKIQDIESLLALLK